MGLTTIGTMYYPPIGWYTLPALGNAILLDAAAEKCAFVLRAPQAGNIRKIHFVTGTVTTGATVDVRIETVSATNGDPTGTLWAANTNVAHTINNTDDNAWLTTAALTADATVAVGDLFAVVIVNDSGSPGNLNIMTTNSWSFSALPYTDHYTASWSKSSGAGGPIVVLEYSDGTTPRIPGVDPFYAVTNATSSSATLYRGMEITMPFTCRAIGFWTFAKPAASSSYTFKLFDADGTTALATNVLDSDQYANFYYVLRIPFAAAVTLKAGSKYWLAGTSDGANNLRLEYVDYATSAILANCAPCGVASWSQATSPTGTGDWTNTATRQPAMGLIIDQIDVSSGPLVGPGRLIRN